MGRPEPRDHTLSVFRTPFGGLPRPRTRPPPLGRVRGKGWGGKGPPVLRVDCVLGTFG